MFLLFWQSFIIFQGQKPWSCSNTQGVPKQDQKSVDAKVCDYESEKGLINENHAAAQWCHDQVVSVVVHPSVDAVCEWCNGLFSGPIVKQSSDQVDRWVEQQLIGAWCSGQMVTLALPFYDICTIF